MKRPVKYYRVKIYSGNITLMVPVNNTSGVQLRPVVSRTEARRVIDGFDCMREDPDIPWNKRYKENVDKLKTGTVDSVADVLSGLIQREKKSRTFHQRQENVYTDKKYSVLRAECCA